MVLEATMICIDNSEWMRNGDYSPNRFQAQADAVNLICGAKTQSNPENTVGILTMAGKGVRVLATPTSDLGKILSCTHGVQIGGDMNLAAGIQVAQLALKHRQNKKQQQRIIVFAAGPVTYDKKVLEMIGKKLKKNSVSLDIVNFGEDDEGKTEKLEALVAAVNNNDTCHIVHVPAGPNNLSDVLISSPIFTSDGEGGSGFAAAAADAGGGVSGFDFGVDPNLDPELALALRVSMEEERARQEAATKRAAEEAGNQEKGESQIASQDVTMLENIAVRISESEGEKDEDALLEQAITMSMEDTSSNIATRDTDMPEAASEDHDLALDMNFSTFPNRARAAPKVPSPVPVVDITGDDDGTPPREPSPPVQPAPSLRGSGSPQGEGEGGEQPRSGDDEPVTGKKKRRRSAKVTAEDPSSSQPVRVAFRGVIAEEIKRHRRGVHEVTESFEKVMGNLALELSRAQEQRTALTREFAAVDAARAALDRELSENKARLALLEEQLLVKDGELSAKDQELSAKDRELALVSEDQARMEEERATREREFPLAAMEWARGHPSEVARVMLGTREETMEFFRLMYKEPEGRDIITTVGSYGYQCGQKEDRIGTHQLLLQRDPDFTPEGYGIDLVPDVEPQPPFPLN